MNEVFPGVRAPPSDNPEGAPQDRIMKNGVDNRKRYEVEVYEEKVGVVDRKRKGYRIDGGCWTHNTHAAGMIAPPILRSAPCVLRCCSARKTCVVIEKKCISVG